MATRTLIHPTTGDCVTVLVAAADSSGALFRFEYDARTPTPPAEDHAHPEVEYVEVVAGTLYCRVDGRERRLVTGESIVFPPWSVHAVWHGEPGVSRSIGEFWSRWHISLSTWLRDYLYVPLGGNQHGSLMTMRNLMITMFLGGLWHGAGFFFIVWGIFHGLLLVLYRLVPIDAFLIRRFGRLGKLLAIVLFFHLVCVGWIFFRADSLTQAGKMFAALLRPAGYADHVLPQSLYLLVAVSAVAYAAALYAVDKLDDYAGRLGAMPSAQRPESMSIALRNRWLWIAPIWATACVLVLTLIPHQSRAANVFLYRYF